MDWNTLANVATGIGTVGALIIAIRSANKRTKATVELHPQPVKVEITEELDDRFASKSDFEKHVDENTKRHSQIFNRIEGVLTEMRNRDEAIMKEMNQNHSSIQRLLGRIEQKIDSK